MLEHSLQGTPRIALGMEYRPHAVKRPWNFPVQPAAQFARPVAPDTSLIQLFENLGEELLILGTPGAGKTTTLLQLAHALIVRAEADYTQPLPVIFTLASWAEQRRPIADWLVSELQTRYAIPRKVGRTWVETGSLIVLLDSLDEVKVGYRGSCVTALNRYRQEHGFAGMVVCSRQDEYSSLDVKLDLQGAVAIQPLTWAQIDTYLAQVDDRHSALRHLLRVNHVLMGLIETPLLLRIASLAYQDQPVTNWSVPALVERWPSSLFAAYVERMVQARGASPRYSRQQVVQGLAWLARCLQEQAQSVFYLKDLNLDWLPTPLARWQYRMLSALSSIGLFGLVGTLVGNWQTGMVTGLFFGLLLIVRSRLPIEKVSLLLGLLSALFTTLNSGALPGLVAGVVGIVLGFLAYAAYLLLEQVTLRLLLSQAGVLPWDRVDFLDFCTERAVLQRVGEGYMFRHHLLSGYFARLND